jgi:CRP/FNR family cyclic AMP-dependent transcriptional regulator
MIEELMDKVIQHFNKGEVVIPEGSQGDRVYRIISGNVLICKKSAQGKMIPITKLAAGEIFGEMYLFNTNGARSASVIAADSLQVEVYFTEDMQTELQKAAPEIQMMLTSLTQRLRSTTSSFAGLFREKMIVELPDGTMRVMDGNDRAPAKTGE